MKLDIQGLGIILYSPFAAAHIGEGEDYLNSHYSDEAAVGPHIRSGTIVGFGTGSAGTFTLEFFPGYPDPTTIESHEFKLRLGVLVRDRTLCVRDLYDLLEWTPECPPEQRLSLEDGYYHLTLCSSAPPSGRLGDDQVIRVYLNPVEAMPALKFAGVPTLCD
jgi:hypothetical protein